MGKTTATRCDWCRAASRCGSSAVAGNDSVAGSDSAAGNGDVTVPLLQCPELIALPSQQGSVFAALKAHLWIGTWIAQRHQAMSPLVQPGLHISC